MLREFLQQRRAFRQRVDREATDLLTWLGEGAYGEARARMRAARRRVDAADERLWSKVTVEIARRSGVEIGKRGRWKWPDAVRIADGTMRGPRAMLRRLVVIQVDRSGLASPSSPSRRHGEASPNRREIADRLVEISRAIADISAGRADATTIHNIGAEARQILDFTGRTPDLEQAVGELIAACEGVVIAPAIDELTQGAYPSSVEAAARALMRVKALTLPA